jgi:thioredoxin 1
MNKVVLGLGILLVMVIVVFAVFSQSSQEKQVSSSSSLKWNIDLNAALQEAKNTNKMVFVDFYADWCPYCKKLDENTFTDPTVQQKLTQSYVLLKIDTEKNPGASSQYQIYGLPTMLVLNADGQEIKRIEGYQTPDQLLSQL